jgi:flagellar hook assembly protein FlgD
MRSYLADAYPNPFNPTTTIGYTMVTDGFAEIAIYDVRGKLVRTLFSGNATAGFKEVVWDGRDDSGGRVASGVYFYQLRAGSVVETKKMVMVK